MAGKLKRDHSSIKRMSSEGSFGIVYSVVCKSDNSKVAVKVIAVFDEKVHREAEILSRLRILEAHRNIVKYIDHWIEDSKSLDGLCRLHQEKKYEGQEPPTEFLAIKMSLCAGSLRQYLDRRNKETSTPPDARRCLCIISDIAEGLKFLHDNKIIHRDMKPANILYDKDDSGNEIFKISDFGLSKELLDDVRSHTKIGTLKYAAQEQRLSTHYNHSADIYSFGLIIFEVLYPMKKSDKDQLFEDLKIRRKLPGSEDELFKKFSRVIIDCTSDIPDERPVLQNREDESKLAIIPLLKSPF